MSLRHRFLEADLPRRVIGFDSETFFSKKLKYSLRNMIAEQYCRSPLFDCYIVSACDGNQDWAGHPTQFNWQSLEGATIVSHNAYWDRTCYNELVRRGIAPKINFKAWHCSANLTSYLCNRRALAQSVEYLYKVKVSKEARDDSDSKHWPQDFSEAEQKRMLDYARGDARWCWKIWNDYSHKWPVSEQRLSNMTIEQGMRGVAINAELLDTYLIQSHEMLLNTQKRLPWLQDDDDEDSWTDFNTKPTSTKCIAEACRRAGIPCPPTKSHEGEEAYFEWEKTYSPRNPFITALSSWRSVNKLFKSFQTVKARLRPDNTMPFGLKFFGAHTGRWSGSDKLNMQNMRKTAIRCNEYGLMEADEKRPSGDWMRYAINFRNLFVPRPGKILVVSDLSQIEPRCLAWLTGNEKLLELVRGGMSIYEAAARASGVFTGDKMDKASVFYAEQKAKTLALGYQAGWERFIEMAADFTGIDITAGDPEFIIDADGKQVSGRGQRAKQIVADFRAANPKIVELWNKLDLAFKRSVGDNLQVALPSGRVLRYESVRAERRLKPDRVTGKPKLSTVFTCDIGGRRFESYGGKICENVCQAFGRDVLAEGMLNVENAGHKILWTEHDSIIAECEPGTDPEEIERLMTITPDWAPGLPLAAEGKVVKCYEK